MFPSLLLLLACQHDYYLDEYNPEVNSPIEDATDLESDGEVEIEVEEVFEQTEKIAPLDVLAVLDRSCSMYEDNERVGVGLGEMLASVDKRTDEWSMTFITTSHLNQASIVYDQDYFQNDGHIKAEMALAPFLLPATGWEWGIPAIFHYLQDNREYYQANRNLLIFILSDEDDGSVMQPDVLHQWLEYGKTLPYKIDVIPIVTIPDSDLDGDGVMESSSCADNPNWIGYKYIKLASLYGNDPVNICDEDWEAWLEDYSFLTILNDHWKLEHDPIPGSVSVTVDGENSDDWYLEGRFVIFNTPPALGAEIKVSYKYIVED